MKTGARLKTVSELLEEISRGDTPADRFLSIYFKKHRFIGSKDRRFITETVYGCLRDKFLLDAAIETFQGRRNPFEKRTILYMLHNGMSLQDLVQSCDNGKYHMSALSASELLFLTQCGPEGLKTFFKIPLSLKQPLFRAFGGGNNAEAQLQALMEKGPVDIRVNTLKASRQDIKEALAKIGIQATPTPHSPTGLRLSKGVSLKNLSLFKEGCFDVQDEGSQLTTFLLGVQQGHKVLDYCAGAGGKTLGLSALMNNQGQIVATDVSPHRLQKAVPRLRRAGCKNVKVDPFFLDKGPTREALFDRIFVDAPCSGSGTWRRHPEELGRTSLETILAFQKTQKKILTSAAQHIKRGGFLLYVTCSIFFEENEDVIEAFLKSHPQWTTVPIHTFCDFLPPSGLGDPTRLRLSPLQTGTDGFFASLLEKKG